MDIYETSHTILKTMIKSRIKEKTCLFNIMMDYSNKYLYIPLCLNLQQYFVEYKTIDIDGYILFRMSEYHYKMDHFFEKLLEHIVVQNKYNEFIVSMQQYVAQNKASEENIYLTYTSGKYLLYNEFGESIIEEARKCYLHEFGAEEEQTDYIFHYLLKILPKTIYILGIENTKFLQTIKLVFDKRLLNVEKIEFC